MNKYIVGARFRNIFDDPIELISTNPYKIKICFPDGADIIEVSEKYLDTLRRC